MSRSTLIIIPNDYKVGDYLTISGGRTVMVTSVEGLKVHIKAMNWRQGLLIWLQNVILEWQVRWWISSIRKRLIKLKDIK